MMSPTDPESLIGQTIEAYRLDSLLGMGGMGAVFLASNQQGQQIAVKILLPPMFINSAQREAFRQRFLLKAQTLSRLRHPHILPVSSYGIAQPTGFAYMLLPYMHGGTFARRLNPPGLPFPLVVTYIQQIASALDYVHEQDILHANLKPANILLNHHDQLFLMDFGIAQTFNMPAALLTSANQTISTLVYMAPEQSANEQISPATDVYSLAILTYQLITGRLPFDISSNQDALPPMILTDLSDLLPTDAARVLLCALAQSPRARFQHVGAFVHAFAAGLQSTLSFSSEPVTELSELNIQTQISRQQAFVQDTPSLYNTVPAPLTVPVPLTLLAPPSSPDPVRVSPLAPTYQMNPGLVVSGFGAKKRRSSFSLWISLLLTFLLLIGFPVLYFFVIVRPGSSYAYNNFSLDSASSTTHNTTHAHIVTPPVRHLPTATLQPTPTVTVAITLQQTPSVHPSPIVTAVPLSPTPVVLQRQLSASTTQSKIITVTGHGTVSATYATGSISIVNYGASGNPQPLSLPVGTVISNTDGCGAANIQVVLDNAVALPVHSGSTAPTMVVQAHTVLTGIAANFAAKCASHYTFDHCEPTCLSPSALAWVAKNFGPFAGASDAITYPIVQQSDIDTAATALKTSTTQSATTKLQGQVQTAEHLLADPQCSSNVSSDHAAGEHTATVIVTVSTTCKATAST